MSSHSPFLLSDLPGGRVLLLENGDIKNNPAFSNTFGANISTLLNEDFFLKNGFIGGYAQKQLTAVVDFLERPMQAGEDATMRDKAQRMIALTGDPLLRNTLKSLYYEHYSVTKEERIQSLEDEIRRLRAEI